MGSPRSGGGRPRAHGVQPTISGPSGVRHSEDGVGAMDADEATDSVTVLSIGGFNSTSGFSGSHSGRCTRLSVPAAGSQTPRTNLLAHAGA